MITNLAFLARALETQINANILSTPTLLTLDNEEARIIVGQNIPFVTGQYANTGKTSTVTPFQTFERRDIGIVLRVKPQITEGGTVRLVIYQEVSRIGRLVDDRHRPVQALARVHGHRRRQTIIVLGGLIQDRLVDGTDKVPVAGDIPLVGQLFRYDAPQEEKTNLMMFIKPTVVRNGAEGREITSERYRYIGRAAGTNPGKRPFWDDPVQPTLPPEGTMPGTPGATVPAPATPTSPLPAWPPGWYLPEGERPAPIAPGTGGARNTGRAVARLAPLTRRPRRGPMAARLPPRSRRFPMRSRARTACFRWRRAGGRRRAHPARRDRRRPRGNRRVLQRPVKTEAVGAERFAAELARAYNTGDAAMAKLSGDLARETDLTRLMQDLPEAEDLLEQGGREAPVSG